MAEEILTIPTTLQMTAENPIEIQAAAADDVNKLPSFTMLAYTGGPMRVAPLPLPVIFKYEGMSLERSSIPIRLNHDSRTGLGHTTEINTRGPVTASGVISRDNEFSREVVSSAKHGFPWQASIGARVLQYHILDAGAKEIVNGAEITGKCIVVEAATLYEISIVDSGADVNTAVQIAAQAQENTLMTDEPKPAETVQAARPAGTMLNDVIQGARHERERQEQIVALAAQYSNEYPSQLELIEKITTGAIEAKSSPESVELEFLRLTKPVNIRPVREKKRISQQIVEAGLAMASGLSNVEKHYKPEVLEAAQQEWPHGLSLNDVIVRAARENGYTGNASRVERDVLVYAFPPVHAAANFSTMSLPGILGNVANKFVAQGFNAVEQSWARIAATKPVRDFKATKSYSLSGDLSYLEVGADGEMKHGTVSENEYSNQAKTYGRVFTITRTALVNDDLGILQSQLANRLGRGGALTLNKIFWAAFKANSAFFTTARSSRITGATSALGVTGLGLAQQEFMEQTDPDGDPLGIMPKILLVPPALATTADGLFISNELRDTTANKTSTVANVFKGQFDVVKSQYLAGEDKKWYLLADPNDLPVIEVAFLNGRNQPFVESADADFDTLGIKFRAYFDFGVALQEYRGGIAADGE